MLLEMLIEIYEEDFTKIHLTTFSKSEMSDIYPYKTRSLEKSLF